MVLHIFHKDKKEKHFEISFHHKKQVLHTLDVYVDNDNEYQFLYLYQILIQFQLEMLY